MVFPGLSAAPMLMGGNRLPAEPFDYSGSWESGADGFIISGETSGNLRMFRSSGAARTGTWKIEGAAGGVLSRTLGKDETRGLYIRASCYFRAQSVNTTSRVQIYLDEVLVADDAVTSFGEYSLATTVGNPVFAGESVVRVKFSLGSAGGGANWSFADDWRIWGVKS